MRTGSDGLLLGEWACLGVLYGAPTHGFAVAARLRPGHDLGRVWSMSRALTYRALDQLEQRDLIHPTAEEPGIAGGNRTILSATRAGRAQFRRWLNTPVPHVRDLRSELLLKVVLADEHGIDIADTLSAQRELVSSVLSGLEVSADEGDVVDVWRHESAGAALRFLDRLLMQPR